jgi:plasmid segregation protein ParM
MVKLGIDVGYSATKGAASNGLTVQFPSFEAIPVASKVDDLFKSKTKHLVRLNINGSRVEKLVGEAALQTSVARGIMGQAEKPDSIHDLLLFTAAYLLGAGSDNLADLGQVDVVLGLPVDYLRRQRDALKARLERSVAWVSVNGGPDKCIELNSVRVFPQGAGIMLGVADPSSILIPGITVNYVLVLDLGSYTTNYLLFKFEGGRPQLVPECIGTLEKGVSLVQQGMADAYQDKTGLPLPAYLAADAFKQQQIFAAGQLIDLSDAIMQAKKAVAEEIAAQIRATLKERMTYVTATLLAGGGALLLEDELQKMAVRTNGHDRPLFPQLIVADNPVFANAIGFLNACMSR